MAAISSIIAGAGLASGLVGGAVAGARGSSQTERTTVAPATGQERELQRRAIDQYLQQIAQINQQQAMAQGLDPLRQQGLESMQGILSGQAFSNNPQELQQINAIREAQIRLGTQDIERQLGERIAQTNAAAGVRGLRGQALGSMQQQNTRLAGEQIGNVVNSAGLQAAQMAAENPYRRLAIQAPMAQNALSYADQLRQQAIQNRQLAANPALLDYMQRERIGSATTTRSTPGGGFLGGLTGAIGGAAGGFNMGVQGAGAFQQLQRSNPSSVEYWR